MLREELFDVVHGGYLFIIGTGQDRARVIFNLEDVRAQPLSNDVAVDELRAVVYIMISTAVVEHHVIKMFLDL